MGDSRIDGKNPSNGHYIVKFSERVNGQNKSTKEIEIPIGTKFSTANRSYEIKADGIYTADGKKIDTLPLSQPQFAALDAIDINNDGKIDQRDALKFMFSKNLSLAREVNKELETTNSEYHVPIVEDSDGGFEMAGVDSNGFSIDFAPNDFDGSDKKLNIELPTIAGTPAPSVPSKTITEQKSEQPEQPHQIAEPHKIEEPNKLWWQFW